MASDTASDELLQTLGKEVLKVFRVYDGSDRCIESYEALANTVNGGPCLKTEYTYIGATTNVEKLKESTATWSSAWDI
jgi:hypothetical protein